MAASKKEHIDIRNKIFFYILVLLCLVIGFILLRPYLALIAMVLITGLIYRPIYTSLLNFFRGRQLIASSLTVVLVFLTIIIPISIAFGIVATQVVSLTNDIRDENVNEDGAINLSTVIDSVNEGIDAIPLLEYEITEESIFDFMQNLIEPLGNLALNNVVSIGNTAADLVAGVIIFLTLLSAILVKHDKLMDIFRQLSPLDNKIDQLYMDRLSAMSVAMVKGTFVVALAQGFFSGVLLWIAGVDYIALWSLLAVLFSLIPLGAGLVTIPIGIFLIISGNIWGGLLQIVGYFLVTSNIDNVLRPQLVPKEAALHPALTVLSLFSGIKLFGFLGIIFGPIIMIFLVTTIEVYLKYYKDNSG
jgi:predicted PurR-regulated permease PerM